ncbi:unnamed protein product, partial [Allacma fusca]
VGVAGVT